VSSEDRPASSLIVKPRTALSCTPATTHQRLQSRLLRDRRNKTDWDVAESPQ